MTFLEERKLDFESQVSIVLKMGIPVARKDDPLDGTWAHLKYVYYITRLKLDKMENVRIRGQSSKVQLTGKA